VPTTTAVTAPPRPGLRVAFAVFACACALAPVAIARATDLGSLEAKFASAPSEAGELAGRLRAAQGELASAQQEAAAAGAHEEELTALLAEGEEHAAELRGRAERSQRRLSAEKRRLGRARG